MRLQGITELDFSEKKVLIREDFNVPIAHGVIQDATRIEAAMPTIREVLAKGAGIILVSHLGRPKTPGDQKVYSLAPVAAYLSEKLGIAVPLITDLKQALLVTPGSVMLLENIRFQAGETSNDVTLAKQLASLCDVFVLDAFGTAHRAHASTVGIISEVALAAAGPLLQQELKELDRCLEAPKSPVVAIVGGAKVSGKLEILQRFVTLMNSLILGGGIANTFLKAAGNNIGASLYEPDLVSAAANILELAAKHNCRICLPHDVVVAKDLHANVGEIKELSAIESSDKIFDIGPKTCGMYTQELLDAATILWNGPVGVFENEAFARGTKVLTETIAASSAYSVAGGGDTLAAINKFNCRPGISYISTGGGAFLEYIEGRELPALAALQQAQQ